MAKTELTSNDIAARLNIGSGSVLRVVRRLGLIGEYRRLNGGTKAPYLISPAVAARVEAALGRK